MLTFKEVNHAHMPRSDRAYTTWQVAYKPANAKKPAVNVMAVNITLLYYGCN